MIASLQKIVELSRQVLDTYNLSEFLEALPAKLFKEMDHSGNAAATWRAEKQNTIEELGFNPLGNYEDQLRDLKEEEYESRDRYFSARNQLCIIWQRYLSDKPAPLIGAYKGLREGLADALTALSSQE